MIDFIDSLPDHIMIILDEAYVEFVTDPEGLRGLEAMSDDPMSWYCGPSPRHTASRVFASATAWPMPRLPLPCARSSLPFGVSVAAQAAVIASLEAESLLLDRVGDLVKARDALAVGLRDLGFDVPDAQGNFVWLPGGPRTGRTRRPLPVPGWPYGRSRRAVMGWSPHHRR